MHVGKVVQWLLEKIGEERFCDVGLMLHTIHYGHVTKIQKTLIQKEKPEKEDDSTSNIPT